MDLETRVVQVGTWLYDGSVEMSVRIVQQNWDYYYEQGFDDEPPELNADGYAFYAVYGTPSPPGPGSPFPVTDYSSRSLTCLSLEEAIKLAESTISGPITWGRLPIGEA